ncbi:Electrogenic sodium bicarbonate cotransporter 4 [Geodia barretti]|nr:Electrogenic sodium bicarbonate cotransporter 4 [Geodia barretti]
MYRIPLIGKIPLTPLTKTSPRSEQRASWGGDQLIGGKYDVTSKDKSVLERISHRAHRHGARVRKPHEVFVELEELKADSEGMEWEETARWIKFEEDVEGRGWGRPHISALTFHSLSALRMTLESGCILLDVEGDDFPSIVRVIVAELVTSGMLPVECVEPVTQVLYKRHKHASHITLWEKLKKSASRGGDENSRSHSSTGLNPLATREGEDGEEGGVMLEEQKRPGILRTITEKVDSNQSISSSSVSKATNKKVLFNISSGTSLHNGAEIVEMSPATEVDSNELITLPNPPLAKTHHHHHHTGSDFLRKWLEEGVMDKIPEGAESLTVLVGGVKFLSEPIVAFVRLAQSHLLGDLTEVPVPVRFIYFLLGPQDCDLDYHEVGRAMATLMSDKHFHEVAYTALMADDLLDAIDVFLDDSIVLPPGDWDENLLLPVMHQRNEMRKRKESKVREHERRKLFAVDPLRHSRRPCGGMWADLKKLVRRYPSDLRDMFHIQTFVSIIFLYVAFLAPAIALEVSWRK